ncbi:MAG: translation initiation factor [Prevotellaceae bacterium]|jgi:translation initiation factor 1|nr:translation initiation factor [Prevotellaceae bacterium]
MKDNDWKSRLNVVYSTKPDYKYTVEADKSDEQQTLPPNRQNLTVCLDKKQRKGKKVTLITGFKGTTEDLKNLGKELKSKCSAGGSVKDGEIIIQGDFCNKILELLIKAGYKAKRTGG